MTMQQPLTLDGSVITGIEEIDRQHQNLFNLTEEARVILAQDPTPDRVRQMIQELLSYAIYHFRTEETLMQRYSYAEETGDAQQHIGEHRQFSAQIVAAQESLQDSKYIDTNELLDFLYARITQHIMNTDKKLTEFILRKRSLQSNDVAAS